MGEPERARHLSDQAFAFLGFAFAAFTPQLAVLAALAVSPVRSVPLPFHGATLGGVPVAFLGVFLLVIFDDFIVAVFVFAAVARYELIRAHGQWPTEGIQLAARDADWSLRRAIALAGLETWFFGRKYRMGAVALVMIVFFVVTSGYLLWLVWIST